MLRLDECPDLGDPAASLQVSATLEKQVRAKETELIDFQEKYKIRLKVKQNHISLQAFKWSVC